MTVSGSKTMRDPGNATYSQSAQPRLDDKELNP